MYIDDLFHAPMDRIAAFAQAQVHLYRHDVGLQDYFLALQSDMSAGPSLNPSRIRVTDRPVATAIRTFDTVRRLRPRRRIKTDVLFCPIPYFERKTENQFLVRALLGLAQTDAQILCLLPNNAPCRGELDERLATAGRSGQVTFLDPSNASDTTDARLCALGGRIRARSALRETLQILEPHGLCPGTEVRWAFERTAHFVEAWDRLAPWVEFDAVVARCHWNMLCSPVCRTARERGKPVITFQQGVIGHTLDAPLTASKYVAFGNSSASFMDRLNARFFQAAGLPTPPVEYVSGGSLFDNLINLPNQFDRQTVLIVDAPASPEDFYGIESQVQALLELASKLLESTRPLRRVVIRPHPYWNNLDLESCKRLVRKHPERCELSHPAWSLEEDLRRSSVVAGIFSGVLTVASACGLPTVFLQTENGYTTGDLACFSPGQTLLPHAAFVEIGKLLADKEEYAEARRVALHNSREYYANGTNLALSGEYFERLLDVNAVPAQAPKNLQ
jgi:hypothetical protein